MNCCHPDIDDMMMINAGRDNYIDNIIMQKYGSKYHVQKVEPVKGRGKNFNRNPIPHYKSHKGSVIPKKIN